MTHDIATHGRYIVEYRYDSPSPDSNSKWFEWGWFVTYSDAMREVDSRMASKSLWRIRRGNELIYQTHFNQQPSHQKPVDDLDAWRRRHIG